MAGRNTSTPVIAPAPNLQPISTNSSIEPPALVFRFPPSVAMEVEVAAEGEKRGVADKGFDEELDNFDHEDTLEIPVMDTEALDKAEKEGILDEAKGKSG